MLTVAFLHFLDLDRTPGFMMGTILNDFAMLSYLVQN